MNPPQPNLQPNMQSAVEPLQDEGDEINLLQLLDVVLDSRWLIAAVIAVAIAIGGGYALLSTPIYEANSLIQVEESKGGRAAATSALGEAASLFEIHSPAAAEIEILHSRQIVGQAVQNLQLDLTVTPEYIPVIGGWLARRATAPSNPGFLGFAGFVSGNESLKVDTFEVPREFEEKRFSVLITDQGLALLSPDGETLAEGRIGKPVDYVIDGQKGRVLISSVVGKPGAQFFVMRSSRLAVTEKLQRSLSIGEKGRQSGVINSSLRGSDPTKIARTLNEIGALYVRQNVARKGAEAEKTLNFLGTMLPKLRAQMEESESKFNQFRNRNGIYDLSTEAKLVLEQSFKLQTSLLELQQKRKDLESRFTAQHPFVQTVDSQIRSVNNQLAALSGRVKAFPNDEQELLRLTRDLKVNTELYASLLNSAQQLRLVKEGTVGNVRVVDMAVAPEAPVEPKGSLIVVSAALAGLLAGLALAFLRNGLRPGIKDPVDIEQHLGLHVFSTIPFTEAQSLLARKAKSKVAGSHVLATVSPQDPAIESLRSLRTALQFAMLETTSNVVLISGPTPGLGKSFTSVNFAAVLGAGNKKILLIDGDLRKGHLNQYFGLGRQQGLSEVVGGSVKLDDALHRQVVPNVDFLATGTLPPNPAELLMTGSARELLQQASAHYDLVIIDTAPVLAAADTAILAPLAGAVFLVARSELTSLGELHESVKRLAQSGVQAKGVIFNGLNIAKRRYGYGLGTKYGGYRYTNYKY